MRVERARAPARSAGCRRGHDQSGRGAVRAENSCFARADSLSLAMSSARLSASRLSAQIDFKILIIDPEDRALRQLFTERRRQSLLTDIEQIENNRRLS